MKIIQSDGCAGPETGGRERKRVREWTREIRQSRERDGSMGAEEGRGGLWRR